MAQIAPERTSIPASRCEAQKNSGARCRRRSASAIVCRNHIITESFRLLRWLLAFIEPLASDHGSIRGARDFRFGFQFSAWMMEYHVQAKIQREVDQ